MDETGFEKLLKLVPPPANVVHKGNPSEWARIEKELGIALPPDYKRFIEVYGTGTLGEDIWINNPFCPEKGLNLLTRTNIEQADLQEARKFYLEFSDIFPNPHFNVFPESNGLFAFGSNITSDYLLWKTEGLPEDWRIVLLGSRIYIYEEYPYGLVDFLIQYLENKIESKLLGFPTLREGNLFVPFSL